MKVCYFGAYLEDSLRNRTLKKGLKDIDIDVLECNASVKVRVWRQYLSLIRKYILMDKKFAVFIVPEFTHQSMPLAWLIKKFFRKPIIFDPDTSLYFSVVFNRKAIGQNSWKAKYLLWLDKVALRLADIVTVTTEQNYNFFKEHFNINESKLRLIHFAIDDDLFYPRKIKKENGMFLVMFWGRYLPGHGIEHILRAAKLLEEDRDIYFELYGQGQDFSQIQNLHKELKLKNLVLKDLIPRERIPDIAAKADVCLGIFGDTEQLERCVSDKILEIMAMRKPLLTAKYPVYTNLFNDGKHCLFCERTNPESLRDAILHLKNNPGLRESIAENGYKLMRERFTSANIGRRLKEVIDECLKR